jgi:hypothetical protein
VALEGDGGVRQHLREANSLPCASPVLQVRDDDARSSL